MKMKQLLAGFLTALLLVTSASPALAAETTASGNATRGKTADLLLEAADAYHPGLKRTDILKGRADGSLDENGAVTRAEALVMLSRAFGTLPAPKGQNARFAYPATNFTDVPAWARKDLANIFDAGIVAGTSATTFSPNSPVTYRQLELFIDRSYALEGSNLADDFYATVNKVSLDSTAIAPTQPAFNVFTDLTVQADADVAAIITEIAGGTPKNAGERKIAALYNNILDMEARNKAGIAPIAPYLAAIESAKSIRDLLAADAKMRAELGGSLLLDFSLTQDVHDSSRYQVYFATLSPNLGKNGYSGATAAQTAAYLGYLETLFTLAGDSVQEAKREAQLVWNTERELASAMLTPEDSADLEKGWHVYTMKQLQALFPKVDMETLFAATGMKKTDTIIVGDEGLLQAAAKLFDEPQLQTLQTFARASLLSAFSGCLSEDFAAAGKTFSQRYYGISEAPGNEEIAAQNVQEILSEYLGEAYVTRHFSEQAKTDVTKMAKEMIAFYRERVRALTWMSETTKTKAIKKLDSMTIKVGYPDKWETSLDGVQLKSGKEGGSFFENLCTIALAAQKELPALQTERVPKGEWGFPPYTVNAFYSPLDNSIEFPAAILQAPFYDEKASYETNLGGIGYVMAHEITHAFDNNGAQFDENGNAVNWWTEADYAAFRALCDKAVAHYDGQEYAPGMTCNGKQTLSENIADLGGAACVTALTGKQANPDYKALYTAMAKIWCSGETKEYARMLQQTDVHSPDKLRVNSVLCNFEPFYTAFEIAPGDGMYLAPEERVQIW